MEIQRLIGRSLRGVLDFEALGERTVYVDCDVLQADGGTRCAAITGGFVALELAGSRLVEEGGLNAVPLTGPVAAVSCGVVDGIVLLDLDYPEDSSAEVDANVVMTGEGRPRRGSGDRRAHAALTRAPRRAAGAREARDRRAPRAPGRRHAVTPRLVLATRNEHKLRELERLLGGVELAPLPAAVELPPEDGATFEANALVKARAAAAATGRTAIADDSGLEAAALGGAPGVRTARFAGPEATDEENLAELIRLVPPGSGLRYVCALVHVTPDGAERTFEGRCDGTMAAAARGTGGFGYDPVFVPADRDDGRTMAELTDADKDAISHRGRAARALAAWLAG